MIILCVNGYHPQQSFIDRRRPHRLLPPRIGTSKDGKHFIILTEPEYSAGGRHFFHHNRRKEWAHRKSNLSSYEACVFLHWELPHSTDAAGADR